MVTVNLTRRCNQQCIYCEIGTSPEPAQPDVLKVADLLRILDDMHKNKIPKMSLCGGEPFLFEGIMNVIEYAGKKQIRVSVTSNGMTVFNLNGHDLEILKKYNAEINISIDSFDDRIQTRTRGNKLALSNALKSVEVLQENGIPVTVLTVISRYNFDSLSVFFKQACEAGIRQILFQPVIVASNYPERPGLDAKSSLNVPFDQIEVLLAEFRNILEYEKRNPVKTNVYRLIPWIEAYLKTAGNPQSGWFFDAVLKKFYCREIDAIVDISYDGGIQPCGLRPAQVFLHQHTGRDLVDLWREATQEIRDDMAAKRYYPECNACCHHFSRNMLASVVKFPFSNNKALFSLLPMMVRRQYAARLNLKK